MPRILRVLSMLLVLSSPALAQLTVGSVTFSNAGSYAPAALESVAGLHHGSPLDKPSLEKSAQNLLDTGLFDDVQFMTEGPNNAVHVAYALTPTASPLLPVQFTNFPWWTSAELTASVQSTVPLFNGTLPETGNLRAAVQSALEKIIATKGITATVADLVSAPSPTHPRKAIAFSIASPKVQLRTVNLTGVPPDMKAAVDKYIGLLIGGEEVESGAASTEDNIAGVFHDAGYFDASVTGVHRTIALAPDSIAIDLTGAVQSGQLYHVSRIDFAGTPILSTADFQKLARLHPGDPAANYPLLATLNAAERPYQKNGYITVQVHAAPSIDAAAHRVAYSVTIVPGQQFHLRSVTPVGLSPQDLAKFQSAFRMKPGDIYDSTYQETFIKDWSAQRPASLPRSFNTKPDPATQSVDLTITFVAH